MKNKYNNIRANSKVHNYHNAYSNKGSIPQKNYKALQYSYSLGSPINSKKLNTEDQTKEKEQKQTLAKSLILEKQNKDKDKEKDKERDKDKEKIGLTKSLLSPYYQNNSNNLGMKLIKSYESKNRPTYTNNRTRNEEMKSTSQTHRNIRFSSRLNDTFRRLSIPKSRESSYDKNLKLVKGENKIDIRKEFEKMENYLKKECQNILNNANDINEEEIILLKNMISNKFDKLENTEPSLSKKN